MIKMKGKRKNLPENPRLEQTREVEKKTTAEKKGEMGLTVTQYPIKGRQSFLAKCSKICWKGRDPNW